MSRWTVENLNAELLDLKLWGEGCSQYQILQTGDDEYCLIRDGDLWQVVYTERGSVGEVLFASTDEAVACEFMYRQITRFTHPHLVGLFQTEAEADRCALVLERLQIQSARDAIPVEGGRLRLRVFDRDIFTVERHLGSQLPLRRCPSVSERIHIALERLRRFDPNVAEISIAPPLGSPAKLRKLEARSGIQLPEIYRTFLLEVCNGGKWERLGHYLSIESIIANNSTELWNRPLPEFLDRLKASQSEDWVECPAARQYPGLLRIVEWDNPVRDLFLTQEGYEVEIQGDWVRFSNYSPERWIEDFLDDIQAALHPFEALLALLRSGTSIQDYPYIHTVNLAQLLTGTLELALDPELTIDRIIAMHPEIDLQLDLWRIEHMGKMRYNFGFDPERAERRTRRILEKLGHLEAKLQQPHR